MADLLAKTDFSIPKLDRGGSVLWYLSIALFFLVLAAFGGITILNRSQQEAHDTMLEEVQSKEGELKTDLLGQIFILDQKLKNLRSIISGHLFPSNVLRLIEQNTLSRVRFLNFSFDTNSRKLDMTGEAGSYSTLAKQIGIFERDPQVEKVEFGGLSINAQNLTGFKITIIFKNGFLRSRL